MKNRILKDIWTNIKLEFSTRKACISTYVYFLIILLLAFFIIAGAAGAFGNVSINFGLSDKVFLNAPFSVAVLSALLTVFTTVIIAPIFGQALYKDIDAKFEPMVMATGVSRAGLFWGRFLGAFFLCALMMFGIILGQYLAYHLPGLEKKSFGPHSFQTFLVAYTSSVLPNILIFGGLFFALIAITRKIAVVYLAGILSFMGFLLAGSLSKDLEDKLIRALVDPFGINAMYHVSEYWSVHERNTLSIPWHGAFLANRLLWMTASVLLLFLALWYFVARANPSNKTSDKSLKQALIKNEPAVVTTKTAAAELLANLNGMIPTSAGGFLTHLRLMLRSSWFEFKLSIFNIYFLCLALAGILYVLISVNQLGTFMGTLIHPVTYKILELTSGVFSLFILIIIAFFAGELIWRDRDYRIAGIIDASPIPTWVSTFSKFLSLLLVISLLASINFALIPLIQIASSFTHFDPGMAFYTLFSINAVNYMILAALIFFIHTMVNQKYLAHGIVILYLIASLWLPDLGWEDHLYRFGEMPSLRYSEMNGYGPFLAPIRAYQVYWGLAALLLLAGNYLLWSRGSETSLKARWRETRHRLADHKNGKILKLASVLLLSLFLIQGSYIFYNTHVLNHFQTSEMGQTNQADYEKQYTQYSLQPQLQYISVNAHVDFFPEQSQMKSILNATLENKTTVDIKDLFLNVPVRKEFFSTSIAGVDLHLIESNESCQVYRYELTPAVKPGQKVEFTYTLNFAPQGFENGKPNTSIVENGSFFNNTQMFPVIGYYYGIELSAERDRERNHLPPKPRMPAIDDERYWQTNYVAPDATWIDFEATVSTSMDQTAIAPGTLQKEWVENNRRYFHYKMDQKVFNYYAFLSARYEVKRDSWKGVNIEVLYQKGHEYNLDSFIAATKEGLDYFNAAFGPYQHRQFRIIEFPRYQTFAQSFPNTIPYSEGVGFIAKIDPDNPKDINYPYYVTAHELAHQWWAHQVISANVQGATLLSESLAQYSALMLMEKKFGRDKMRRYLQHEMDSYLQNRARERVAEKPLYLNENQPYIHYNKGSLAFYALRETIGEDALNAAIRKFRDANAYQEPPYTNALKFVEFLKANVDPRFHTVIDDQLMKITLYDNKLMTPQVKEDHGEYVVDLTVRGRKIFADGIGKEEEASFSQPMTISLEGKDATTVHSEVIELKSGDHHLTLRVKEKPTKILLDPQGIWIDKNRSDNELRL